MLDRDDLQRLCLAQGYPCGPDILDRLFSCMDGDQSRPGPNGALGLCSQHLGWGLTVRAYHLLTVRSRDAFFFGRD